MPFLDLNSLAALVFPKVPQLSGGQPVALEPMPGGASLRRYYRLRLSGGSFPSLVIMELGDLPISDEANNNFGEELPFLAVQRYLALGGVAVPTVYQHDREHGLIFLEDLGDVTFESRVVNADDLTRRRYYRAAIDELLRLQRLGDRFPNSSCIAFQRRFDADLLRLELEHFREYGLKGLERALTADDERALDRIFGAIVDELSQASLHLVHRDFQSRNLMVQDSATGLRLRVIDFQDALLGPVAYDLVGLLRDSYVALTSAQLEEYLDYYLVTSKASSEFSRLFWLQTVQRKLKDAGRFVFIEDVKKLPGFKVHIPRSLSYVDHALTHLPELAWLKERLHLWFPELSSL